jgi:hypothetical protein
MVYARKRLLLFIRAGFEKGLEPIHQRHRPSAFAMAAFARSIIAS